MKIKAVLLLTVLALLIAMLPMSSAFAKKPVPVVAINVHNQSGGSITLTLTDTIGNPRFFVFKPEGSSDTVPAGIYKYYLLTPCGFERGIWNMTRTKELSVYCAKEGREVNLYHLK
ncbi:MAG: hypothetical protein NTW32_05750 [Chloroflexi bacterium]|nr:hypothetical protein [Chloroflexota bacterium]